MALTDIWNDSVNSLLHGQNNNIFDGKWAYDIDFEDATWIKSVITEYTVSTGNTVDSQCQVYVQYSKDRLSWSNWLLVPNSSRDNSDQLVEIPLVINDLVYGLKFKIILSDGWDGTLTIPPVVKLLRYYKVTPSKTYYITPTHSNAGMIFEYVLSASATIPKTAQLKWGIVRGSSTDFSDFETVIKGKKGVLPNRQSGIRYTDKITRSALSAKSTDNQTYQVYEKNNTTAQWSDTDLVLW